MSTTILPITMVLKCVERIFPCNNSFANVAFVTWQAIALERQLTFYTFRSVFGFFLSFVIICVIHKLTKVYNEKNGTTKSS